MEYIFLRFSSVTYAHMAQTLLERHGLWSYMMRIPKKAADEGCGYVVKIRRRDREAALDLMYSARIRVKQVHDSF